MNKSKEYKRGYASAEELITVKGHKAIDLLNEARTSLTNDDFDKGWKDACKEFLN